MSEINKLKFAKVGLTRAIIDQSVLPSAAEHAVARRRQARTAEQVKGRDAP